MFHLSIYVSATDCAEVTFILDVIATSDGGYLDGDGGYVTITQCTYKGVY